MLTPKRSVTLGLALASALVAGTATAERYDDGATYYVDAPVVHVEPITRYVRISEPREVCWDERVHHTVRGRDRGHGGTKGAIVGSILGGAIGNNVADGEDDRQTARLAGAILGGVVGHTVGQGRGHGRGHERRVVRTERRCEVEHVSHREERVTGYRVTYRYDGRHLTTRRPHDPGERIRVRVRVDPGH